MEIQFACSCGARLKAPVEKAGRRARCPSCGNSVDVPPVRSSHEVFISYSSKDKTTADAACAFLESQGLRCWIAPRDVLPGMEYAEAIINGIVGCRVMLLVFSTSANDSPQVRREVERALSKDKPILPFRTENILPSRALEYCLGNTHWLDAYTPPLEAHLVKLAQSIKHLLGTDFQAGPLPPTPQAPPSASPPPPPPARPPTRPTAKSGQELILPRGYKFVDLIARTSLSVVIRVIDERTGQASVLKQTKQVGQQRLDIAAQGVQCPGILLPLKTWSEGGMSYELLNWVEGCTLAAILEQAHVPVLGSLLDFWVTSLVELLMPLHFARPPIVHRDITPANVMVSLTDMSLSLIDTSGACLAGLPQHPMGSPSYAPGEQLAGHAVPASDLYAIGALSYHLAMARLPPNFTSRELAAKKGAPLSVAVSAGERSGLARWIEMMLELDPKSRPSTADDALINKPSEDTLIGGSYGILPLPNGGSVDMTEFRFRVTPPA